MIDNNKLLVGLTSSVFDDNDAKLDRRLFFVVIGGTTSHAIGQKTVRHVFPEKHLKVSQQGVFDRELRVDDHAVLPRKRSKSEGITCVVVVPRFCHRSTVVVEVLAGGHPSIRGRREAMFVDDRVLIALANREEVLLKELHALAFFIVIELVQ